MPHKPLAISLLLILIAPIAGCADSACFFEDGNATITILDEASIIPYNASKTLDFIVASTYEDAVNGSSNCLETTIAEIKQEFDVRVEVANPYVINKASFFAKPSGYTIEQIYLIHQNITNKWHYLYDPRGVEYYRYANESLRQGPLNGYEATGDCDDFAILMSSLIENIGGRTRIILANGNDGGHAYAEVYVGKKNDPDLNRIIKWLRNKYQEKIYCHIDEETGSIWLNLDWGSDDQHADPRLGGPFFQADYHTVIFIGKMMDGSPPTPQNEPPNAVMRLSQNNPISGEEIEFNASETYDLDNNTRRYDWNFGDDTANETGEVVRHTYERGGKYSIVLTVTDRMGAISEISQNVTVNVPPDASFSYNPINPKVGETVYFDASNSSDIDGSIIYYKWDYHDLTSGQRWVGGEGEAMTMRSSWLFPAMTNIAVNLTVRDDKGAEGSNSTTIKINALPIANFIFKPNYPNPRAEIAFDASASNDTDGSIINYAWDFMGETRYGNPVIYRFAEGGNFTVKLEIRDDNDASASFDKVIIVNMPPKVDFSYTEVASPGQSILFDASASNDSDGIANYKWDFSNFSAPQSTPYSKIQHEYSDAGMYNVTLEVTDKKGASNTIIKQIAIENASVPDLSSIPPGQSGSFGISSNEFADQKEHLEEQIIALSDNAAKLIVLEKYDEALDFLNKATNINDSYEDAWFNKAIVLVMNEKYYDAINASDRALELNMSDAEASSNKARAVSVVHSPEKAIPWFVRAIDLNPNLAEAWYGKGDAFFNMGRFDEAIYCYNKAIMINDSKKLNAEVYYARARSTYYLGKAQNDTELINDSIKIYNYAVGEGYIVGHTEDGSPFGFTDRTFEISWMSLVHPRMSNSDETRKLREIA